MIQKIFTIIVIIFIAVMFFMAQLKHEDNKVEALERVNGKKVLSTDSCGWKVYVITYKDKEYMVNSKGGIVEIKKDKGE